jgi:hypothetical protein
MMEKKLIAPCGMNCGICKYYYREKNICPGCRGPNENKAKYCIECKIVNCEVIKNSDFGFCYDCSNVSCKRLKNLDKRYSTKYHMSMLENLDFIKEKGINAFLEKEKQKWECPNCGGIVTCHGGRCLNCGFEKFKN